MESILVVMALCLFYFGSSIEIITQLENETQQMKTKKKDLKEVELEWPDNFRSHPENEV